MNTLISVLIWSRLFSVDASFKGAMDSVEDVSILYCVIQRDVVLHCHIKNMNDNKGHVSYINQDRRACVRSQIRRAPDSDFSLRTWALCTDNESHLTETGASLVSSRKKTNQLQHPMFEKGFKHKRTTGKGSTDGILEQLEMKAKQYERKAIHKKRRGFSAIADLKVTLKTITHIAACTGYENIVFGHGPIIEEPDCLLSMVLPGRSSRLKVRPAVHQHRIGTLPRKLSMEGMGKIVRGLTTGPCIEEDGYCLFICFLGTRNTVLRVLGETSGSKGNMQTRVHLIPVTKRLLVSSISLNMKKVLYMLVHTHTGDIIKAYQLAFTADGDISSTEIGSADVLDASTSIDVMKPDGAVFCRYGKRLLAQTKESFRNNVSSVDGRSSYLNHVTFDNKTLFCTYKWKYVLLVSKYFPFQMWRLSVGA